MSVCEREKDRVWIWPEGPLDRARSSLILLTPSLSKWGHLPYSPGLSQGHTKGQKVQLQKAPVWGQIFLAEKSQSVVLDIWMPGASDAGAMPSLMQPSAIRTTASTLEHSEGGAFAHPQALFLGVLFNEMPKECSFSSSLSRTYVKEITYHSGLS